MSHFLRALSVSLVRTMYDSVVLPVVCRGWRMTRRATSSLVRVRNIATRISPPTPAPIRSIGRLSPLRTGMICGVVASFFVLQARMAYWARMPMRQPKTNDELVAYLKEKEIISSPEVEMALLAVDRGNYVVPRNSPEAYLDSALPIGYGATISAPHMHGMCLEALSKYLQPGARALDVGSGSGYISACMAVMVQPEGKVFGIDVKPELVELSKENIGRDHPELLSQGLLSLKPGDGWQGWPEEAPFDCIHVGAAADEIPQALVAQLKPGGRMVVPVGRAGGPQKLLQVDKTEEGKIVTKELVDVAFVPLVHAH